MIVYGVSLSPFVRKVLVYGAEKGLGLEVKRIGLGNPDPAFREASPFGKMPGFRDGDFAISDSTAIITYLETKNPEPPLIPAVAEARARTIWFDEFADTILSAAGGKIFFNRFIAAMIGQTPDMAAADKAAAEELPPVLDYIERILPDSGHLIDDRLTLADIAVASPLVNLMHCGIDVSSGERPKLAKFAQTMLARPSFAGLLGAERKMLGIA